ncbi:hypothetical protein DFJ74DRAFT_680208, partial [Hyaloraphidium curvatum]
HRDACGLLRHPLDFAWAAFVVEMSLRLGFTHGHRPRAPTTTQCPALHATFGHDGGMVIAVSNAESDRTRTLLAARQREGKLFPPDAFNAHVSWSPDGGLITQLATPGTPASDAQRDARYLSASEARSNESGRIVLALARDLGIAAAAVIAPWSVLPGTAIAALPWQPAILPANLSACKVRRIGDGQTKPQGPEEFLHRKDGPAPVLNPEALDPRNPSSPLYFRSAAPPSAYDPDAIEGRIPISSAHPGPFFALPGDGTAALLLCTALPDPSPNPLGLAPGTRAPIVEVNTHTGGFRILEAEGWRFGTVPAAGLAGFMEAMGAVCLDCASPQGPAGWRWGKGKRAVTEERIRRFGVKKCGRSPGSRIYEPLPVE